MTEILKICDSAKIATAARSWIGTPFHHQGRSKGVGVDCLGLLVGVATELGLHDSQGRLVADFDNVSYGHFPNEEQLYNGLRQVLSPVEKPKIGSIGLFNIDGYARHLGVFANDCGYLTIIHAYAPARKVIEHRFDDSWKNKLAMVFEIS